MTVAECSLTSCMWTPFQRGSHIVSPPQLRRIKGVCMFRCNRLSALLAEWPRILMCHCSNMGVEWTLNKSQHTKLTLVKKILPLLLPGFKVATFWSRVQRFTNKLSQLYLSAGALNQQQLTMGIKRALSSHLHVLEFEVTAHSSTTNH